MDNLLIKTNRYEERGMFVVAVYGLNIFVTNEQAVDVDEDPRIEFMRRIGENLHRIAHVGDMALEGDDPQDYFTAKTWDSHHVSTSVGLYNGSFYAGYGENGYVFFDVQPYFWKTLADDRSGGINYVIGDDSLAMYIHRDASSINALTNLVEQPVAGVPTETLSNSVILPDWINQITTVFDYCVVTVADGWHTLIYSKHKIDDSFVQVSIEAATKKIITSDWYVANEKSLLWEDEFTKSMVTPEIMKRYEELKLRSTEHDNEV